FFVKPAARMGAAIPSPSGRRAGTNLAVHLILVNTEERHRSMKMRPASRANIFMGNPGVAGLSVLTRRSRRDDDLIWYWRKEARQMARQIRMPGRPEEELPNLGDIMRGLGGRGLRNLLLVALGTAIVLWLASGLYTVGPGSQGVVLQFGQEVAKTDAGLNYHLPWPIQTATVVNLAEVRRLNIGFEEMEQGQVQEKLDEALMLTRDENIVNVHVIVQYRVLDASQFLFNVQDVPRVLKSATEVTLRSVVGNNPIDSVLTERRAEIQDETKASLQGLMDDYRSGITVTEVKLQEVDAPKEVRDAFHEVVRAREDRERLVREAEGYQADIVPKVRGEKEKTIKAAEAYKEQRILRAQGDAQKFLSVLQEYQKAPNVTRQRIYLETIEPILSGIDKIIIDSRMASNLLPFLPLKGFPEAGLSQPPGGGEEKQTSPEEEAPPAPPKEEASPEEKSS
ncbi:MAG: FtsH protease activity modulator HflK, partial [Chloroflexota bacterium]